MPKAGGAFTGDITTKNITIESSFKISGDGSGLTNLNLPPTTSFKGTTDVTTATAPSAVAGDTYLNTVAGAAGASWTGIATETVQVNQFVIYGTEWETATVLDNSAFVTIGTDQTVTGAKNFTGNVQVPTTPAGGSSAASKSYVDTEIAGIDTSAGTVQSVNSVDPDGDGNVTLTAANVGAIGTTGGVMTGNLTMSESDGSVIVFSSQQTFPSDIPVNPANLPDASANQKGITFLSDSTTSTKDASQETAATPVAVKTAKDAADAAEASATAAQTTADTGVANAATAQAAADSAQSDATTAVQTAQAAQNDATQGIADAATAQAAAVAAQSTADGAVTDAATAQAAAVAAQTTADTGVANAATADAKAVAAQGTADTALANAATADGKAVAAQTDATQALTDAATADAKAVAAQGDATTALTNAATADAKAVAAQTTADTGVANAATAQAAAVAAQGDATQALADAATADAKAVTADGKAVAADAKAVAAQATADAALPKAGGAMSGTLTSQNITIAENFIISGDGSGLTNLTLPAGITYEGTVDCVTQDPTSTPAQGQMYLNIQQGTAKNTWAGLATQTVELNQFILFDGTNWDTGAILDGSAFVTLSTTQTIPSTKIFTQAVTVGTPTAQDSATTKLYVDNKIGTDISAIDFPVDSVNGDTGTVVITAAGLSAMSLEDTNVQVMKGNIDMKTNSAIIVFDDEQPFPTDIVPDTDLLPHATVNAQGITQLYNGVDSSSDGTDTENPLAATPGSVKTAYDKAIDAETDAATAQAAAVTAKAVADLAHDEAGEAQTDATSALANAATADAKAVAAQTAADAAQVTADGAVPKTGNTNITGDITIDGDVTVTGTGHKFVGDGSGLTNLDIPSAIQYKGSINCVTETAPVAPQTGWSFLNTGTGVADASWTGLQNVIAEQFVLYNGDKWETGAVLDDAVYVTLATTQVVTGQKSFNSQVLIPETPTQNASAASKKYVDDEIQTEFGKVDFPVISVNGQAKGINGNLTGAVALTSSDVGALSTGGGTITGNIVMSETDSSIIDFSSAQTFPGTITSIPEATATITGSVKLSDSVASADGVDDGTAATPKAVKSAKDTANTAVTNAATADAKAVAAQTDATQALADAATADAKAVAAQTTADAAMPKVGGTFTGDITTENITISSGSSISGDGSGLTNLNIPASITFKGTIDVTTGTAPSATAGDIYLNTVAGDAVASYTGIATQQVAVNQFVLFGTTWSKGSILDGSAFVTLTSQQTITGSKTFSKEVVLSQAPTANTSATNKLYVDGRRYRWTWND